MTSRPNESDGLGSLDSPQETTGVVVCIKWVATRPDIDPLTGEVTIDPRFSGISAADHTALELGIRLAKANHCEMTVLTVGSDESDAALRDALAAGADHAIRLDPNSDIEHDSADVAAALASASRNARYVLCGSFSLDRGSGSVPAFLAAELGASQALGIIDMSISSEDAQVTATRRLDQGRRETLTVQCPAVISVEPSVELRRSSLSAVLVAQEAHISVRSIKLPQPRLSVVSDGPLKPRTRTIKPPTGSTQDRIKALTGVSTDRTPPRRLELEAEEAAQVVVDHLEQWGYLEQ